MEEASSSFRKTILRNMLVSLGGLLDKQSMTLKERKGAIKLSADVAAAAARGGRANWSRALIGDVCQKEESRALVTGMLVGRDRLERWARARSACGGVAKSRGVVRRSLAGARGKRVVKKGGGGGGEASRTARGAVREKARVLKKLVPGPGGERLAGGYYSLLGEALDYVAHLKAQVDLLRTLSDAVELLNGSSSSAALMQDEEGLCSPDQVGSC